MLYRLKRNVADKIMNKNDSQAHSLSTGRQLPTFRKENDGFIFCDRQVIKLSATYKVKFNLRTQDFVEIPSACYNKVSDIGYVHKLQIYVIFTSCEKK